METTHVGSIRGKLPQTSLVGHLPALALEPVGASLTAVVRLRVLAVTFPTDEEKPVQVILEPWVVEVVEGKDAATCQSMIEAGIARRAKQGTLELGENTIRIVDMPNFYTGAS